MHFVFVATRIPVVVGAFIRPSGVTFWKVPPPSKLHTAPALSSLITLALLTFISKRTIFLSPAFASNLTEILWNSPSSELSHKATPSDLEVAKFAQIAKMRIDEQCWWSHDVQVQAACQYFVSEHWPTVRCKSLHAGVYLKLRKKTENLPWRMTKLGFPLAIHAVSWLNFDWLSELISFVGARRVVHSEMTVYCLSVKTDDNTRCYSRSGARFQLFAVLMAVPHMSQVWLPAQPVPEPYICLFVR